MAEERQLEDRDEPDKDAVVIEDVEILKKTLVEEKAKAERYLANWQRAQADYINYKKRAEQEKSELAEVVSAALIVKMLPVVDDLERAFVSLPPKLQTLSWTDGIRLIYRKLRAILEAYGVTEIKAKGERFDPKFHEAAVYEDGGDEGMVMEELQKGYKLKERILRPAVVVVGKGKKEEANSEPSQNTLEE